MLNPLHRFSCIATSLLTFAIFGALAEEKGDVFINPQNSEEKAPANPKSATPIPVSNRAPAAVENNQPTADDKNAPPAPAAGPVVIVPGYHLSLEAAIEIAVLNNLGLKIARLNDRVSDVNLKVAWAQYYPEFRFGVNNSNSNRLVPNVLNPAILDRQTGNAVTSFTGGMTQRSPWGTELDFAFSDNRTSLDRSAGGDASARLRQPLWKGAGTDVGLSEIRTARINRLISRGVLDRQTQQLIFSVRQAYANVIRGIQNQAVNEQSVRSARRFLDMTDAREKAGQVTKLDVFNADVQLRNRELDLIVTNRNLESALDQLKRLMDIDLEERVLVDAPTVDFGDVPEPDTKKEIVIDEPLGTVTLVVAKNDKPVGEPKILFKATRFDEGLILKEALDNRIDLLNAHRNLAIQKLQTLLAKDGLGHQVDLVASLDRATTDRSIIETSNGREVNSWSVGLNAVFPWGKIRDRAAYERALLELQRVEIELKDARTQVQIEVRDNMRALRQLEKTMLVDGRKVEAAKRGVDAVQSAFDRGLKDSFDVIRSEDDLLRAKVEFINATQDYVVNLANLEVVVGKPTGRVNLEGDSLGGLIDAKIPEEIKAKGMPKPQPEPESRPEDNPLSKIRVYRKDYNAGKNRPLIIEENK